MAMNEYKKNFDQLIRYSTPCTAQLTVSPVSTSVVPYSFGHLPLAIFYLLLLLSITVVPVEAREVRLCGKKLTKVLQKICKDKFNRPTEEQLRHHKSASSSSIGIADHCCTRRCSFSYLRSFCDDSQENSG